MLGYESAKRPERHDAEESFTSTKTLKLTHTTSTLTNHASNGGLVTNENEPHTTPNLTSNSNCGALPPAPPKSFESLFEAFTQANSSKSIVRAFDQMCKHLKINPKQVSETGFDLNTLVSASQQQHRNKSYSNLSQQGRMHHQVHQPAPNYTRLLYRIIKGKTNYWKANELWKKYDKRANMKDYMVNRSASSTVSDLNVLVVGCGPVGLRFAIECALMGLKCSVVEKRDRFSRNNVVHLWPFTITDLKSLGAKLFYGKFCAGSIDHISKLSKN
jgi:hypothetical protein